MFYDLHLFTSNLTYPSQTTICKRLMVYFCFRDTPKVLPHLPPGSRSVLHFELGKESRRGMESICEILQNIHNIYKMAAKEKPRLSQTCFWGHESAPKRYFAKWGCFRQPFCIHCIYLVYISYIDSIPP